MFAYISSDFSNFNVFQNSHSSKPLLYKITGTWGNHEGSMLLWLLIMSLYNVFFSFNITLEDHVRKLTIVFQSFLYLCFSLFVILTSNPFLVNSIDSNEGLGLNPILQDPALAIHPPVLYIGYVGFSLILSLALAGLILNQLDNLWIQVIKRWAMFCWLMLTGGIALGSYWAYYELGWGGWWFWDPVENVSLMPWITGLALVHSLMITKQEQLLKRWVVFLSILCFSLSILGTFLVRSGILTSVHSFAADASRGIFILILFLTITGFSFIIFILKSPHSNKQINLLFINKTSALIINNIVMLIACITILLGTIYPIIIEVLTNKRMSVGAPYYNSTVLPILLPGFLIMSIAPMLSWQSNKLDKIKNYIYILIVTSILTLLITYLTKFNIWGFTGTILGLWIIAASLLSILHNCLKYKFKKFFIYNNALIAHMGVGIMIIGITFSSIFQTKNNFTIQTGEIVNSGQYSLQLKNLKIEEKNNFQELLGIFLLHKKNEFLTTIKSSKRYYYVSKVITTEAGIYHDWFQDFYLVLGNEKNNKWSITIYHNPLVSFIWIGVMIMIFSGMVGIFKR
ncbi:MAG TPA: heme lyase CcmF/NrfE family subunit, partial [Pelagibacterales bacterium]|jgi:cytochrome c-type biogenesis protein CcmF|nr:heme lyase CcmF/NrfE family subunit [Pelagibacterales bacterium]